MKTKLFLMMLVTFGALSSCSKDEDPAPLTKDQADVVVTDLNTNYTSEIAAMDNNEGVKVSETLDSLNLPFVLPIGEESGRRHMNSFYSRMEQGDIASLKRSVAPRSSEFVFGEFVGTWDWNSDTQQFDRSSSTPTNQIVLKFPFPINNATNNATYTITKYTIGASLGDATGEYAANITINGSEVWNVSYFVSVNKSAITYNGNEIYTSLTTPKVVYEYNSSMSMSGSASGTVSEVVVNATQSLKKNGETKLSGAYSISTKTSETAYSITAKASLIVAKIKFVCEVSYSGSSSSGSAAITQSVKMSVYTVDGAKVGDIKYEVVNGVTIAMFYYTNGDKVPAAELFGEVFGKWDSIFGDIVDF